MRASEASTGRALSDDPHRRTNEAKMDPPHQLPYRGASGSDAPPAKFEEITTRSGTSAGPWGDRLDNDKPSRSTGSVSLPPTFEPIRALAYVIEPRAPSYRAIMSVFAAAKRRYVIQLRPSEVEAELRKEGIELDLPEGGIEELLDQLTRWGNLRRNHDSASAQTLEEFQRRRAIYVLTAEGEAAEQAIARVLEAMERSGSLQKVMFTAILEKLRRLHVAASQDPDDSAVIFRVLSELYADFTSLTENASLFLSSIQQALDSETYDTDVFRSYKYAVIEYLERFISELKRQEDAIAEAIQRVEKIGIEALVAVAAKETESPRPDGGVSSDRDLLLTKWRGIRDWFMGDGKQRPLAEGLRAAATSAIARMLRILNHLNEQRFRRVSRVADFQQIAVWFESMEDEGDAHALFKDAFGLSPPRHILQLPGEDDASSAKASWSNIEPVTVPWALRARARPTRAGRPGRREDFTDAKARLEAARRERETRTEEALKVFVGRGRLRASELPTLTAEAIDALLEYLDACLTTGTTGDGPRVVRSPDGRFILTIEIHATHHHVPIQSDTGTLHARDFYVTVEEAPT